jgi:tetratricopeptide (TPR) repeat protein
LSTGNDDKLAELLARGNILLNRFLEGTPETRREMQKSLLQLIEDVTRESQTYYRKGQYSEAHNLYRFLRELGKQLTLKNVEAKGWTGIGRVFLKMKRYEAAVDNLLMALSLVHELGYKDEERNIAFAIGLAYQAKGSYTEALGYFEECLRIERELVNPIGEVAILCQLGECFREMGEFNKALDSLQLALKLTRETGHTESEGAIIRMIREVNKAMTQR